MFRTEFLYFERGAQLTEEEQYALYAAVASQAVALVERLAKQAAFFSVGMNNLTQTLTCVQRQQTGTADFPEAVQTVLKQVLDIARKEGIPVILCGEAAADSAFVRRAATWGADAVSVAPGEMATLKQALAAMRSSEKAP